MKTVTLESTEGEVKAETHAVNLPRYQESDDSV